MCIPLLPSPIFVGKNDTYYAKHTVVSYIFDKKKIRTDLTRTPLNLGSSELVTQKMAS